VYEQTHLNSVTQSANELPQNVLDKPVEMNTENQKEKLERIAYNKQSLPKIGITYSTSFPEKAVLLSNGIESPYPYLEPNSQRRTTPGGLYAYAIVENTSDFLFIPSEMVMLTVEEYGPYATIQSFEPSRSDNKNTAFTKSLQTIKGTELYPGAPEFLAYVPESKRIITERYGGDGCGAGGVIEIRSLNWNLIKSFDTGMGCSKAPRFLRYVDSSLIFAIPNYEDNLGDEFGFPFTDLLTYNVITNTSKTVKLNYEALRDYNQVFYEHNKKISQFYLSKNEVILEKYIDEENTERIIVDTDNGEFHSITESEYNDRKQIKNWIIEIVTSARKLNAFEKTTANEERWNWEGRNELLERFDKMVQTPPTIQYLTNDENRVIRETGIKIYDNVKREYGPQFETELLIEKIERYTL
jgi:hypothetical protein